MKKLIVSLFMIALLSACTMTVEEVFLIPTATLTASRVPSSTPTDMPTFTATIPTSTYTVTPTLIGVKSITPTLEASLTPTAFTPFNMITPDTLTPTVVMEGFVTVFTSADTFYKKGCEPGSVKFTAQVAKAFETNFVVLFVRFRSKQTRVTSEWTSIGMVHIGAGTFTHDLVPEEMKAVDAYKNAWVEYQLVSSNLDAIELGRTAIFSEKLQLLDCTPTATVTVAPTATKLKP